MTIRFPDGFLWGAATSAYQIEGSPLADGAGPSIWHRFSHSAGRTANGETGDIACDHYRRYVDDVALMRDLGLNAYRFSISWSRVLPDGRGRMNAAGLAFYDRLVDALLGAGIQPNVTLYHWDLPAALDDRGGWLNPDVANWFGEYARVVFEKLDDRVRMWTTLNEPWVVTDGGYLRGALAPGHQNLYEAPIATHNLLRAHATAVEAYRSVGKHGIGIVVNLEPKYAASQREEDQAATRRADAYMNRQYLDPLLLGGYPNELREIFGDAWPDHPEAELEHLRQPIDFIGVNYYTRSVTRNDPAAWPVHASSVAQPRHAYTETGWEVYADGLTDTLEWVTERYGCIPLYVTENGAAFADEKGPDGAVHDPRRIEYLDAHFRAAHRAIADDVDLRGYFVWSLLDNFEWAFGYSKRFGL
ncbi:MAG TPA: GH1 family beta-glucosidase, partial [Gemmatimonadaceae bacterium]|nr:GH1 family beta-glucosidase [Gemmatimonadaceae bacterium]